MLNSLMTLYDQEIPVYWMTVDYQISGLPYTLSGTYTTGNKQFTILKQCRLRITLSTSSNLANASFRVNGVEKWYQSAAGSRTDYWDATIGDLIMLNINLAYPTSTATVDADIVAHWSNVSNSDCHSSIS